MTVSTRQEHSAAVERPRLGPSDRVIDDAFAASVLPRRQVGAHKWGVGGLLIVAGSPSYVGAAVLCAQAAGRAGAGIINLAVPRGLVSAIAASVPEAAYLLLSESESSGGARKVIEQLTAKLEKSAAMVVGPGLGDDEATSALLSAMFDLGSAHRTIGFGAGSGIGFATGALTAAAPETEAKAAVVAAKPLVIDADALNWLAKQEDWQRSMPRGHAVLTPHAGEMSRLLGREVAEITADPLTTVRDAARTWGQTVVYKYGYAAVSDGERTMIVDDAPPSLATAGTGDILAGTIGAFLAQGLAPFDAAALALYVGCRAARRVERQTGTLGLIASDLPLAIAAELATLEQHGGSPRD